MPELRGRISRHEPTLPARVLSHELHIGGAGRIRIVLDTGFTGDLVLPRSVIRRLRTDRVGVERYELANGSVVKLPVHRATVVIGGRPTQVEVVPTSGAGLIGMALLERTSRSVLLRLRERTVLVELFKRGRGRQR